MKKLPLKTLQNQLTGQHRLTHLYSTSDTTYIVGESTPAYDNFQAANGVTRVLLVQVKVNDSDNEVKELWVDAHGRETRVFVGLQPGKLFFYLFGWDDISKELIAESVMVDPGTF